MDYPFFPDDHERNQDPKRIQAADQMYAKADDMLAQVLSGICRMEPSIYAHANHDASVLFDYLRGFILRTHQAGGDDAIVVTSVICAAALTRLARAPRADNNPLAHLEKEIQQDDDHN